MVEEINWKEKVDSQLKVIDEIKNTPMLSNKVKYILLENQTKTYMISDLNKGCPDDVLKKLMDKHSELVMTLDHIFGADGPLNIEIFKETEDAVIPTIAYDGTSACFDITAIETVTIPAKGSAMIENGLKIIVPHGWYMTLNTRSGHGIKKDLLCFRGIIDTGYTGPLGVKIFNLSDKNVVIEKGDRYVQASFHRVAPIRFTEIDENRFKEIEENSKRGSKGWGSTGTK